MNECEATAMYPDGHDVLACWLEEDHDGAHHDTADLVMWDETDGHVTFWPEREPRP